MWNDYMDNAPGTLLSDPTVQNTWLTFWTTIIDRYNGNPTVVAVDILNEPYNIGRFGTPIPSSVTDPQGAWESLAARGVGTLKQHNPNLLFVVQQYAFNDNCGPLWRDHNFLRGANIVFSDHMQYHGAIWRDWYSYYMSGNVATGKTTLANFIDNNWLVFPQEGIAFWVGEVGAIDTDPYWSQQLVDELTLLRQRSIGYSCFTYQVYPWQEPYDVISRENPFAYVLTDVGQLFSSQIW
jgi:aryl-phospho-beta-D-glucosidase BglC (GH1 family)